MRKRQILRVGLSLALAAAVGFYLEHGPRFTVSTDITPASDAELLHEPRAIPDIAFVEGDQRPTRLSSFRGKVILLNIWATWCVPCRKEMPALDRLQASFSKSNFEVVALSIDTDGLPIVRQFYLRTGIRQLRVYLDKSGHAMSDLGVAAVPTTLLIDQHGNEIGRQIGPAMWDSPTLVKMIRNRLDEPANRPK